jgi:hypothetical protein
LKKTTPQPALGKAATGVRARAQEDIDRLAIERGENEGMVVHEGVTSNIHNSKVHNDITAR